MNAPEDAPVNQVARIMLAAWEKAEGKPVNASYVATFADMARAVLAEYVTEREAQALRDFAARSDDMARAWGGPAAWITTGEKVASIVREWAMDAADEIEQEADRG